MISDDSLLTIVARCLSHYADLRIMPACSRNAAVLAGNAL
jgi:hypothetical protein